LPVRQTRRDFGIPARTLAAVTTGETVRREEPLAGAVFTRAAHPYRTLLEGVAARQAALIAA